ncbi:MAG: hypothetical protein H7Y15_11970 [Pseudonocardia sp.]|nr:hypothetical protein [Pseudonocardia sp.]
MRDRLHIAPGRGVRVNLRLSEAERVQVAEAALAAGLTVSGFCAVAALAAARGEPGPGSEREALRALMVELFGARSAVNRFGSNVNQVAVAVNASGEPPPYARVAVELCGRAVGRLDEVVARVRRRLG